MANRNLTNAKKAKNDEFYTQFVDIQKEVESYLEYDKNTFRDKTIYCNCDDPYESNFFKYFVLNFKRLGLKRLITTSYRPSPVANTQIGLFGDNKTLVPEKGRPKVTANKFIITEVGDYDDNGQFNLEDVSRQLKENKHNEWTPLQGDGDFRSAECIELLNQADIVVTNPPFSLFREYVTQLVEYKKKFLIIGNQNAITYKEIFPLIKDNLMWLGLTMNGSNRWFAVPDDYPLREEAAGSKIENGRKMLFVNSVVWYTNLDHGRRHEALSLMTESENLKFAPSLRGKSSYDRYDNYDAVEVPTYKVIPSDSTEVMGVPISFLHKYNPDQFDIIGMTKTPIGTHLRTKIYGKQVQVSKDGRESMVTKLNDGSAIEINEPLINKTYYKVGDRMYFATFPRILIKFRRPER